MAKISKPLKVNDLFNKYSDDVDKLLNAISSISQYTKYYHWDKFRHLFSTLEDAEIHWLALKSHRSSNLKTISQLVDKEGFSFKFTIPDICQSTIHSIDQLHARLTDYKSANAARAEFLINSLTMEEAIASSQLEGAATTRIVAKKMLEQERKARNKDEQMILNNFFLMKHAVKTSKEPLSLELIKKFHEIATKNVDENKVKPGAFRLSNDVYVIGRDNEILHSPPEYLSLEERLTQLCEFANKNHDGEEGKKFIHPVVKAIILHFMIGYEHPFVDGNGRTARAIFYWFMEKSGYSDFKYLSISKLLKNAPAKYARSYLYTETDDNDLTYFIDYQLSIIARAIKELFEYLERKQKEFFETINWLKDTKLANELNQREILILKKAIKDPGRIFTAKEIKNDLGVSENTARKYLNNLADCKLLLKSTSDKQILYISSRDIIEKIKEKDK